MAIYRKRWEHRALYNNTTHTHARAHAHTHTCMHARMHIRMHAHTQASDKGIGMAVKNSLEIIIKQVRLEGGFKRGGRIRVVECLRQIVPNRRASTRNRSFTSDGAAVSILITYPDTLHAASHGRLVQRHPACLRASHLGVTVTYSDQQFHRC